MPRSWSASKRIKHPLVYRQSRPEKGFERKDILELFRFIDCLMNLPEALEILFEETLE
jgi:hypothetical protein